MMNFGEWLKNKIIESGMNQADFADRLNIARSLVSMWVNDKRFPDNAELERDIKSLENENKKEIENLKKTQLDIDKKLSNLMRAVENGLDSILIKDRIVQFETRKKQIDEEMNALSQIRGIKVTKEKVIEEMKNWVDGFKNAETPLERKQFTKYIVKSALVKPDKSLVVKLRFDERSKSIGAGSGMSSLLLLLRNRRYIFRN
ncbi:MAG: helix-turn-helix transcriptional regulator [Atribacterota bacterium]